MRLEGKKVIQIVSKDFEDLELWYPVLRLREEGAEVHIAGEKANETYIGKYGVPIVSEYSFEEINPEEYDAILVPGGWSPDLLRRFDSVLNMVRTLNDQNKPIGQICHAGWVLISAKILEGKTVTSTPGIKDDMMNAGATWVDKPVVVDGNIVSSRRPPDLPDYMREFIKVLES
ncbi:PfpI family intracellular peptidase [Alkalihalophilus pseudofirmus OF4]|uniref:PfpI family intracellular peptidase n=3 Tax=Alkalihalophilus pseudofirmus TaxID=79885 RepID=D3FQC8_ALKPO|nr:MULTISPECIES: type 1 glutamine amidotransferase domain-containing protein [Alkalihalophilus]ADC49600.1 PfpI family intracellular peptidase [Alkalihalophilus pseudofirmus OF4]MED1600496.1 type 1 glutamine amidotransferase [Alkalihalophilus marmarensis]WEG16937.1 type 1 glutamine amidotransferase [Alkalihalophilus pseudofirmus]